MTATTLSPAPPVLDVPDSHVAALSWEALFRTQVTLMRRFAADDIWGPLTVREYDVLFTLARGPEHGLRLNELNKDVLISQPSLSRMVDRLESQGLVVKKPSAADRRGLLIALTPAGREAQRAIGRRHVDSIRAYVEPALTIDEMRTLEHLCTKLRTAQAGIAPRPATPPSVPDEERTS